MNWNELKNKLKQAYNICGICLNKNEFWGFFGKIEKHMSIIAYRLELFTYLSKSLPRGNSRWDEISKNVLTVVTGFKNVKLLYRQTNFYEKEENTRY